MELKIKQWCTCKCVGQSETMLVLRQGFIYFGDIYYILGSIYDTVKVVIGNCVVIKLFFSGLYILISGLVVYK